MPIRLAVDHHRDEQIAYIGDCVRGGCTIPRRPRNVRERSYMRQFSCLRGAAPETSRCFRGARDVDCEDSSSCCVHADGVFGVCHTERLVAGGFVVLIILGRDILVVFEDDGGTVVVLEAEALVWAVSK